MNKKNIAKLSLLLVLTVFAGLLWQSAANGYRGRYSGLSGVPQGSIVLWGKETVPSGWAICDGTNGTPDLRNNFVIGAGDTYALDDTGGATTHVHSVDVQGATDTLSTDAGSIPNDGAAFNDELQGHIHTANADVSSHMPPYYALYYIMKL